MFRAFYCLTMAALLVSLASWSYDEYPEIGAFLNEVNKGKTELTEVSYAPAVYFKPSTNTHYEVRKEKIEFFVVHSTANNTDTATAVWHAAYLNTISREVSWHYSVDDSIIYQHFADSLVCYHATSRTINRMSIGIEMCEQEGYDREKLMNNLNFLLTRLKEKYPKARVMYHDEVAGVTKHCPRILDPRSRKELKDKFNEF